MAWIKSCCAGLPPGMRFVPGLSDAVRASIGREVRQMLDKITYVADLVSLLSTGGDLRFVDSIYKQH